MVRTFPPPMPETMGLDGVNAMRSSFILPADTCSITNEPSASMALASHPPPDALPSRGHVCTRPPVNGRPSRCSALPSTRPPRARTMRTGGVSFSGSTSATTGTDAA